MFLCRTDDREKDPDGRQRRREYNPETFMRTSVVAGALDSIRKRLGREELISAADDEAGKEGGGGQTINLWRDMTSPSLCMPARLCLSPNSALLLGAADNGTIAGPAGGKFSNYSKWSSRPCSLS